MRLKHLMIALSGTGVVLFHSLPSSAAPIDSNGAREFDKAEIRTEQIAPGVAVLFGVGGNIGVSYGPDGVVLVDDQYAPLTDKIRAAVAGLNSGPIRFVINTHWHIDHSGGNENLGKSGVTIFAHDRVRMRLLEGGMVAGTWMPPASPAALPVVTFDRGVTFHLNGDAIETIFTGGGHTDGDSVIFWRKANVLHTGDLMMVGKGFPFIDMNSGGSAEQFVQSLDKLVARTDPATRIIPGHGPVSDQATLIAWRNMVASAIDTVHRMTEAGASTSEISQAAAIKVLDVPGAFFPAAKFIESVRTTHTKLR